MTPAETLREAARVVREHAAKATPGEWVVWGARSAPYDGPLDPPPPDYWRLSRDDELAHVDTETEADAAWIALVGPHIGEPLAEWLEVAASAAEDPDCQSDWRWHLVVTGALALARALLREQP